MVDDPGDPRPRVPAAAQQSARAGRPHHSGRAASFRHRCRPKRAPTIPRLAILVGLRGPTIAAATVKRDGTVTAVLEVRPDGTMAPIQGQCMAVTACFDPGLEWPVPLLATRTGLYAGMDRVDSTHFRKVGSGLPAFGDHLFLWDLAFASYGERHLYATVVSDTGDQAAGVYTTTDAQGNGWTKVTGPPTNAVYGPIAAGGIIQYVANDQASWQRARSVYVAGTPPARRTCACTAAGTPAPRGSTPSTSHPIQRITRAAPPRT